MQQGCEPENQIPAEEIADSLSARLNRRRFVLFFRSIDFVIFSKNHIVSPEFMQYPLHQVRFNKLRIRIPFRILKLFQKLA